MIFSHKAHNGPALSDLQILVSGAFLEFSVHTALYCYLAMQWYIPSSGAGEGPDRILRAEQTTHTTHSQSTRFSKACSLPTLEAINYNEFQMKRRGEKVLLNNDPNIFLALCYKNI